MENRNTKNTVINREQEYRENKNKERKGIQGEPRIHREQEYREYSNIGRTGKHGEQE